MSITLEVKQVNVNIYKGYINPIDIAIKWKIDLTVKYQFVISESVSGMILGHTCKGIKSLYKCKRDALRLLSNRLIK